jgi:uncharacterized protein
MGLFGVGGSSVATPLLSLLSAPAFAALGALAYARCATVRWRAAGWSLLGGLPGTVLGALLSRAVGGAALVAATALVGVLGGLLAQRVEAATMRRAFGWFVVVFGAAFTIRHVAAG